MSLAIVRALGLVTIQDLGRRGSMHEAVPPGGALVPSLLVRANRRARNPDGAAALEVCGQLVVRALARLRVATDRVACELAAGDELVVASAPSRVTYLALAGGVAAPVVLGSRATQLSAGIGALIRAGDVVTAMPHAGEALRDDDVGTIAWGEIRIIAGPDLDAFARDAIDVLCAARYRVGAASDRVGTRLDGAAIARRDEHVELTRPMVIGALEVPRDGLPIVLGPEHPTTGGYPILAVIASPDLDAFHAIAPGGSVRFRT